MMISNMYNLKLAMLLAGGVSVLSFSLPSFATNGMNMEGYGAEAGAMGGASMAYNNGVAAVMNNPATLALMNEGNRIDGALGRLGPDVSTTIPVGSGGSGMANESSATDFYMPAVGWAHKTANITYGVAVFSQGGMGTEYGKNSDLAMGSGDVVRSEVGVARIVFPFAYAFSANVSVGGSLDYVQASMDMKMAVPTSQLGMMVTGASNNWGQALPSLGGLDWGRFDFSDNSDYSGQATGTGFAGKLGITYKASSQFSFGATYHTKTYVSDLEGDASLSAGMFGGDAMAAFDGNIKIVDFQWPATYAVGLAFTPTERFLLAADIKTIAWSSVMDKFEMTFSAEGMGSLNVAMDQQWDNQTVFLLGASYKVSPEFTIRGGINSSNNPVPNNTVNPLFPAIVENHYTLGTGYQFADNQAVNFCVVFAPEVNVENSMSGSKISHGQTNWQLAYSVWF